MRIFKTFTFTWRQGLLFKWGVFALGIAAGAYWQRLFDPYLMLLIIFAVGSLAYPTYVWGKQIGPPSGPMRQEWPGFSLRQKDNLVCFLFISRDRGAKMTQKPSLPQSLHSVQLRLTGYGTKYPSGHLLIMYSTKNGISENRAYHGVEFQGRNLPTPFPNAARRRYALPSLSG